MPIFNFKIGFVLVCHDYIYLLLFKIDFFQLVAIIARIQKHLLVLYILIIGFFLQLLLLVFLLFNSEKWSWIAMIIHFLLFLKSIFCIRFPFWIHARIFVQFKLILRNSSFLPNFERAWIWKFLKIIFWNNYFLILVFINHLAHKFITKFISLS